MATGNTASKGTHFNSNASLRMVNQMRCGRCLASMDANAFTSRRYLLDLSACSPRNVGMWNVVLLFTFSTPSS